MKEIALILFMCSATENVCMPAYVWPDSFDDDYSCMIAGYEEALNKMKEIGREEVNKYQMYIRFTCTPVDTI